PAAYSARKCSNTPRQYSSEKSRKWIGMPSRPLTATASRRSSSARQSPLPSSAQFCMNRPASGSPASRSSSAATEESTPPDMPMMVLGEDMGTAERKMAGSAGDGGRGPRRQAPDGGQPA